MEEESTPRCWMMEEDEEGVRVLLMVWISRSLPLMIVNLPEERRVSTAARRMDVAPALDYYKEQFFSM